MALRISKQDLLSVVDGVWATADGAQLSGVAERVVHDSRELRGGEIFVALAGASTDGAAFVEQAFERGAAVSIVAQDRADIVTGPARATMILVADPLQAYWSLAKWWRRKLQTPLIAVTGSVGKTTVKELLACILMTSGNGHYSQGSYNNHTGVPYTLCGLDPAHRWGVVEVGMNNPGEIAQLIRLVEPQVALITCVAPAHLGHFKSIQEIAWAKLEIVEGVCESGTLVFNLDDALLSRELESKLQEYEHLKLSVRSFGASAGAAVRIVATKSAGLSGIKTSLDVGGAQLNLQLPLPGTHNAHNVAAAVLGALALVPDVDLDKLSAALRRFVPPLMRLQVHQTKQGVQVLNDAYNANPRSMEAVIQLAGELQRSGQSVALVLGDMLELGTASSDLHQELGRQVAQLQPACVAYVGQFSADFALGLGHHESFFTSKDYNAVAKFVSTKSIAAVLVKASRGVGLEKIVSELIVLYGGEQVSANSQFSCGTPCG